MTATVAENFQADVLEAEDPILALFHAHWCGFCRAYLPHFRGLTPQNVRLVEVDISDDDDPLWDTYQIEVIPSLLLFHQGEVVERADGRYLQGLTGEDLSRLLAAGEALGKG